MLSYDIVCSETLSASAAKCLNPTTMEELRLVVLNLQLLLKENLSLQLLLEKHQLAEIVAARAFGNFVFGMLVDWLWLPLFVCLKAVWIQSQSIGEEL